MKSTVNFLKTPKTRNQGGEQKQHGLMLKFDPENRGDFWRFLEIPDLETTKKLGGKLLMLVLGSVIFVS